MSDDVKDELREAIRIGEDGSSTWLPDALARIEELEADVEAMHRQLDYLNYVPWKGKP